MAHPCICLDVGGTQIKAAAVSADGGLRTPLRVWDAHAGEEAEKVLDHLASIARQAGGAQAPQDVRLAFPGPFDYENGVCQMRGVAKYDRLYGVNVRLALAQRLNLTPQRLRFCNDAAAFALGEMAFGDAAGAQRAMFVCVGTGCGSAFGVNGRLAPEGFPGVPPGGLIYNAPFLSSCVDDHLSRRGLMALSLDAWAKRWTEKPWRSAPKQATAKPSPALKPLANAFATAWNRLCGRLSRSWYVWADRLPKAPTGFAAPWRRYAAAGRQRCASRGIRRCARCKDC